VASVRRFLLRLGNLFRPGRAESDLARELDAHLALVADELERRGLTPEDARLAARREFGGVERAKDLHRDARSFAWLDEVRQDVGYALRMLRRSPGFTGVAVVTLAVGIGINAAVFTVTNATLFKGFPLVHRNDRLLYMTSGPGCCVSYPAFEDWRAQAKSFSGMAIVHGVQRTVSDQSGYAEQYEATEVSADTFRVAGQSPMLGRDFSPADETPGARPVAMLSYSFWDRRFSRDPAVIGRSIRISGTPTTVIGVMPHGFSFPQRVDLWVPLVPTADVRRRENRDTWFVFGRLADGVTFEAARAEMATIGRRLEIAYPETDKGFLPVVARFHEFFIGSNATLIYEAMWGAVSFVLLIACANLANLLLARAISRVRETSVRMALGAGRWRIVRQFVLESLMLSAAGGFVGWWIAKWGVRAYTVFASGSGLSPDIRGTWFDNVLDYSPDFRVFAYLAAISIGTGLLFGLAPARRLSKLDVNAALKDGGRGSLGHGGHLSGLLVAAEMALAIVLLAGAAVMIRSFWNVYTADVGFKAENVVVALLSLTGDRYRTGEAQTAFFDALAARVGTIPGVESVSVGALPGGGAQRIPYEVEGAAPTDDQRRPRLWGSTIGSGYFATLGVSLLSGRDFNDTDRPAALPVLIVNERFANRHWPGQNPLGKRLRLFRGQAPGPWTTVVGIASNVAQNDPLQPDANALVYLPFRQAPRPSSWIVARTRVPPGAISAGIRGEVRAMDSTLPIPLGPFALADRMADRYRYRAITGVLFLACAAVALLLASVGLYAVVSHSVSRRTQEIGIRLAIGATARDILALVFRQGLLPSAAGLAVGLAASYAVNRALEAQLVQVSPADPVALAASSAALALSAVLGCWIPARRAMRVDPVVALRHE
jgi:putative ABC transport system permease protein